MQFAVNLRMRDNLSMTSPVKRAHPEDRISPPIDLYQVMKELRQVGFNGAMVPDLVPLLAGDKGIRPAGTAYCIACMRSWLRRANEEVG